MEILNKVLFRSLEKAFDVKHILEKQRSVILSGLKDELRPYYLAGLFYFEDLIGPSKEPVLIFPSDKKRADYVFRLLSFWNLFFASVLKTTPCKIEMFPDLEEDGRPSLARGKTILRQQILGDLIKSKPKFYIIPISAISQPLPSSKKFAEKVIGLRVEQKISPEELSQKLDKTSFIFEKNVAEKGAFQKLGGVINLFPIDFENPIRVEFSDDRIENIKAYDLKTKKILNSLNSLNIIPINIKETKKGGLLDYLNTLRNPFLVLEDPKEILEQITASELDELSKFESITSRFKKITFETFPSALKNEVRLSYSPPRLYHHNLENLKKEIKDRQKENYEIIICTSYKNQFKELIPNLKSVHFVEREKIDLAEIDIASGFINKNAKIWLILDKEIFGIKEIDIKERKRIDRAFISSFEIGDFVVHIDHGIGKFQGMAKRTIDEGIREFLIIEYAEHDKLFLPAEYTDKISKYIGLARPKIHRLHEASWHQTKEKVKENAKKQAEELLALYAKREVASGFMFSRDTLKQKELEDSFEYQETKDQLKVLAEIKADMEGKKISDNELDFPASISTKRPMDRIICGDVGFGKTEIALRAAFKATQDKKQVALLCPTTILTQQHYDTFVKRLKIFPTKVEVLSRFKNKKEQEEIIEKIALGEIDIIIGTHGLLSPDIKFHDLGLLIIDEEQRFGVKHKEKIKKMRSSVDILTLSATPIPRTLHLALSGLKNISTIATPPPGRQPVETFILPKSDDVTHSAILAELKRKGQVYYLHNRVETINAQEKRISKLIPEAEIGIVHGKLPEKEIAKVMHDFDTKKIDILICSSIIENGLDLPNVNTLIVDNAVLFGLADLYQLRGRIGRSEKKGYAYFFYQSEKMSDKAKKRLEALLSARELASGFQIALQDLEIRGAGNILGKEQSGNINEVGLSLYCKLLNQAVKEIKTGKKEDLALDVTIDLPINAHLPQEFLPNAKERLKLYQQMTTIYDLDDLKNFMDKIKEKQKLPKEVENLFEILELKILVRNAKIKNIDTKIIQKLSGEKFYRYVLEFEQIPSYEKIKKLLAINPFWVLDNNLLKIDQENLGKNWLKALKETLILLKK
jgi:transcription-repair coupling factor (superfamily II helicase)